MRGEHRPPSWRRGRVPGSPPHARGARPNCPRQCLPLGITPACAGSTIPSASRSATWGDHPRMRGEHSRRAQNRESCNGSPPHARGAHELEADPVELIGITPACAGSTCSSSAAWPAPRDHPRMRGEHSTATGAASAPSGSPPHARGARGRDRVGVGAVGITPACAGSTPSCTPGSSGNSDHPRMRGEHDIAPYVAAFEAGSPPHARGAHGLRRQARRARRITPACAGSTPAAGWQYRPGPDHPRMRGEHVGWGSGGAGFGGSPPHARGARRGQALDAHAAGITPACAGSTPRACRSSRPAPDHPRMRGEHFCLFSSSASQSGSPPHARGAQTLHVTDQRLARITPACAGSTHPGRFGRRRERDHPRMRGEHAR